MVATTYPGIYIEEFNPPSPISGVGTSTAAFIGTALKGPIGQPTELTSWDQFMSTFGGFVTDSPGGYLAPAVYGFFLNGGTDCFVVRASTAGQASASLNDRPDPPTPPDPANPPEPLLVMTAIDEGVSGDNIRVTVSDSSYLQNYLAGIPNVTNPKVSVHYVEGTVKQLSGDRLTVTFDSVTGAFRPGEALELVAGTVVVPGLMVDKVTGSGPGSVVVLTTSVPSLDPYAGATLRSVDLMPGQTEILVDVPTGASLALALPTGTTIQLGGTTDPADIHTVATAGDAQAGPTITLAAGLKNKWVLTTATPEVTSLEFDLTVELLVAGSPAKTEPFTLLSMSPSHPRWWGSIVVSTLVTLAPPPEPPKSPHTDPRPEKVTASPLTGGVDDDRVSAWTGLTGGTPVLDTLLSTLTPYGQVDLVCVPGATTQAAQQTIVDYCASLKNRFAIVDSQFPAANNDVKTQVAWLRTANSFAALYYPWILVQSQVTGLNEYWPPSGHIAGIYARTDQQHGVHVAPANAAVVGALDVEKRLSDLDQGPLNLDGINVLRVFPGQSTPVVWGARTTDIEDKYWQYVNIRRLFIYLEQSIERGIRWAVFQPNDQTLWQQLKRSISDFLTNVWQSGALVGTKASEAFYVRIDDALNPESERALGRLTIEIGVSPAYPAEFIVVRIGIWQGGSQITGG